MGLELVGGGQGQGTGSAQGAAEQSDRLAQQLAEAERLIAGSRQRLQALVDRAADLRHRLSGTSGSSSGERTGDDDRGTVPPTA